ncbi:hypothetical protein CKQ54_05320 [Rahnella variigena]|uniref:Uncharacterized protein n=1 Tax=Rahnella variigena TaxID=574964 RepID=A0ABX9PTC0_9GAMM|nr:hypothetical protein D6D38_10385 [Rahnella variigena]RKF67829.1 hypothetical protein CKQ54_05320 [Rahnella variigena]
MHRRWRHSVTRITDPCQLIGIPSLAATPVTLDKQKFSLRKEADAPVVPRRITSTVLPAGRG